MKTFDGSTPAFYLGKKHAKGKYEQKAQETLLNVGRYVFQTIALRTHLRLFNII